MVSRDRVDSADDVECCCSLSYVCCSPDGNFIVYTSWSDYCKLLVYCHSLFYGRLLVKSHNIHRTHVYLCLWWYYVPSTPILNCFNRAVQVSSVIRILPSLLLQISWNLPSK